MRSVDGYSTSEAAEIAGVTYRRIDYWARERIVAPTVPADGSGSQRRYNRSDLVRLVACRRLVDAGVGLDTIRWLFDAAANEIADERFDVSLLIVGSRVMAADPAETAVAIAETNGVMQVLPLRVVVDEVDGQLARR